MSDAAMILGDGSFNGENIRKVWHKGEWYFSVVDMITEAMERDYSSAIEYWRRLRHRLSKEGNETVANLDVMKLVGNDGKQRKTEIANIEQALRLMQEIPGARTDRIKNWLAQVGAERLEEAGDAELALLVRLNATTERYKSEGKSESWIEARKEGIFARKQFVDALQAAIFDAMPTMYAMATEKVYKGLWNRTTAQLRGELDLTPKQNPRDHFGEYALIYTRLAEKASAEKLGQAEVVPMVVAMEIVWTVAKMISGHAREMSALLGYDLVTEKPLLRGG